MSRFSVLTILLVCSLFSAEFNALAASTPDEAFKADCASHLRPADITVRLVSPLPNYDYTKTAAQISAMHPSGAGITVGLTTTQQAMKLTPKSALWARSDGIACTRPSFEMLVTQATTVYVAKEFPRGSCSYLETKTHELRHVRAHKEHAELVARQIELEMRKAFGNDVYYGETNSLTLALKSSVVDGWFGQFKKALAGVSAWNALIDSPQEYKRMDVVCNNESAKLLHRAPGK